MHLLFADKFGKTTVIVRQSEDDKLRVDAGATAHLEIGENSSDVFFKAHVNHPVGLIQGQVAADVQAHHLLLEQIHQPARGGYHHVDAAEVGRGKKQIQTENQQQHFSNISITMQ